jgi:hypothetical protein
LRKIVTKKRVGWHLLLLLVLVTGLPGCSPGISSNVTLTPSISQTPPAPTEQRDNPPPTTPDSSPISITTANPDNTPLPVTTPTPAKNESNFVLPPADFIVDKNRTDLSRPVRVFKETYGGNIIDTHAHVDASQSGSINTESLSLVVQSIDNAKGDYIIAMPVPNQGVVKYWALFAEQNKKLLDLGGDKIRLFCESSSISNWLDAAFHNGYNEKKLKKILDGLAADIIDPDCRGIGEIGLYHFNKTGDQNIIEYPPNFTPFIEVIDLIAKAGMWLDLHAEPVDPDGKSYEDQVFGGLALLYQQFPDLKLILSHTAMTNPANVRKILETYPNVMMNFKPVTDHDVWRNLEPVTDVQGHLYEDWAELFEDMPERFMVGTDMKFGQVNGNDVAAYRTETDLVKKILGSIAPDAAKLIAFKNAERIFK